MGTDSGWSRAAGESSGRWRTIIDRATGRGRAEPEEQQPEPGRTEHGRGTPPMPDDATTLFAPIPPAGYSPAPYPPPVAPCGAPVSWRMPGGV